MLNITQNRFVRSKTNQKSQLKDLLAQKCYAVKIALNHEEAELNRRKLEKLKTVEEQLRVKIEEKKLRQ